MRFRAGKGSHLHRRQCHLFCVPICQASADGTALKGPDSRGDSKIPPGYPVLLAASMAVSKNYEQFDSTTARMLMDLAAAFIMYRTMFRLSLPNAGLLADVSGCLSTGYRHLDLGHC